MKLLILISSELLTFLVLWQHYKNRSRLKLYSSILINSILSIYMWILFIEVSSYKGNSDNPAHIWLMMNLTGTFCAVLAPRVILDLLHFTGKLIRIRKGGHIRSVTNAGLIIWLFIFMIILSGNKIGRFNFKTEEVSLKIPGLN